MLKINVTMSGPTQFIDLHNTQSEHTEISDRPSRVANRSRSQT